MLGGGVCTGRLWLLRKGQPYRSSKGLSPVGSRGAARIQVRARGSREGQEFLVSRVSLVRWVFKMLLARSTVPGD